MNDQDARDNRKHREGREDREDREDRKAWEGRKARDAQGARESRRGEGARGRGARDTQDARGTRDSRDRDSGHQDSGHQDSGHQDSREARKSEDARNQGARDTQDARDTRDNRDQDSPDRDSREARKGEDARNQGARDTRDAQGARDARGARDTQGARDARDRDTRDTRDQDTRRLAAVMHLAFFVLLGASLARYLIRHPGSAVTGWIIALSVVLALLYVWGGPAFGASPTPRRLIWLGAVVGIWVALVVLAPSFAWCAVPLLYTGLRTLPARPALALVAALTAFVVAAQLRLADGFDPNLVLAPPAVAAIAVAVFVHMQRQSERLAATERREGTLAERQRLAMEIHDSLAQGLSSQQMLLQAADRVWDTDPATARDHVRTAESFADRNLAEARRFVHDLAPSELADGGGLAAALRALAVRESTAELTVTCRVEEAAGAPGVLPDRVQSALLRIAQGALANVREHAAATTAVLTLTHLGDQVVLDIADDGRGFDPAALAPPDVRGHGLPAIRARLGQLGGTLTVESAPGEGTVLSAAIPLEH